MEKAGCDVLFHLWQIYPEETGNNKKYELGYLGNSFGGQIQARAFPGRVPGSSPVIENCANRPAIPWPKRLPAMHGDHKND